MNSSFNKSIIILLAVVLLGGLAFGEDITVTIYSDEGYPPYAFGEAGKAKGAYVDLLQTAASRLKGYRLIISPIAWKRGQALMASGEIFGLFPTYARPKERPYMDYVLKLGDEKNVVLLNAAGPVKASAVWPDDFRGLTVGTNAGFVLLHPWKDLIKIDESYNNFTALKKLFMRHLDGYANDELSMLASVKDMKAKGELPADASFVVGPTVTKEATFLSITTVDKGQFPYKADFTAKFNTILDRMRASGEADAILGRYR